ncbi:MAG: septum formation inhibitor Maf [Cyanobacteriota bacterium]|jgi:septum formation protein
MNVPSFVLASASSARRRLLESIGISAIICPSDFDESLVPLTEPSNYVQILAEKKAETIALAFEDHPDYLVLGCDSILVINGDIYGKPADAQDAIGRWQTMRGNVGQLYTGHALIDLGKNRTLVRCQVTQVYFANIGDRQISAYVATGEPLNCAGCFAIESKGGLFVEKIEGCHTNVIGLSLPLLRQMLEELDYDITDFWQ